jgi:hypothetical protein
MKRFHRPKDYKNGYTEVAWYAFALIVGGAAFYLFAVLLMGLGVPH